MKKNKNSKLTVLSPMISLSGHSYKIYRNTFKEYFARIPKLKQVKKMTSAVSDPLTENPQQEKYHLNMTNRL